MNIHKKNLIYVSIIAALFIATTLVSVFLGIYAHKNNLLNELILFQENQTYYNNKCDSFKIQNKNLSNNQIVFIGDSITDGYKLDNFYNSLPLATYNRGINGDSTGGVLKRLQTSLFDIKPSKVVIMIGINDINANKSETEIISNYEEILTQISTNLPTTQVYCMSILPINSQIEANTNIKVETSTPKILSINPRILNLCQTFNYSFVDMFTQFADSNNQLKETYSTDGIHLNDAGYQVWTNQLIDLLK